MIGSKEGGMIFGPFLRSGTTMFATLEDKRKFIGCEVSSGYVDSYEENYRLYPNGLAKGK